MKLNILGKRYLFFGFSLLLIIPGMLILIFRGIPVSIDFTGGSLLEIQFNSGVTPPPAEIVSFLNTTGVADVVVQTTGRDSVIIRTPFLDDATRATLATSIGENFNDTVTVLRFDSVGPVIGKEVTIRALFAVIVAALLVVGYITLAFRGVQHAFRYGICAILAMIHDVAIILSIVAIGSVVAGWQVDSLFLTALLTVIGFSMQDTIVVFDRVRENSVIYRKLPFETLVNHSIVQTLQRSINTQLMTVEFMLLSLVLFGGVTLQQFSLVLLVGLLSGTYSSIFIAAPVLVVWQNKEWRTWFRRNKQATLPG